MTPSMYRRLQSVLKWAAPAEEALTSTPRRPAVPQRTTALRVSQTLTQPAEPDSPPPSKPRIGLPRNPRYGMPASKERARRKRKLREKPFQSRQCGHDPPTNRLVQALRTRHENITAESWTNATLVATSTSPRQAILTHQFVLKQNEEKLKTSVSQILTPQSIRWQTRLNSYAMRGVQEEDAQHWVWVLGASSTDEKVDRLVSSDRFKPIFVLMAILRTDEHIVKGSTVVKIYDYIVRTYIAVNMEAKRAAKEEFNAGLRGKTLDSVGNMTPSHFMLLIKRLVHHVLRAFPSSLPMVSRLLVLYLRTLGDWEPKRGGQLSGYATHCLLFNFGLDQFRRMPPNGSVVNMPYNWKAQKTLLAYSASLQRPYVITRQAYGAIRIVLVGLQKNQDERWIASRHTKTWPPYIRPLDGTDEARQQEDYYSRPVKAGMLKQSDGYSHGILDYAVDRAGGALLGQAVAIQTRAAPKGLWRTQPTASSIFTYWAAKVRTTRDAYEAWQIFQQAPAAGLKPDFQVYAEMFAKLYAVDVAERTTSLPGDGKETWPPYLDNLTDFERLRVMPCSPSQLYDRMLRSGQRPVHHCLSILIENATDMKEVCRFLNDSLLDKVAIRHMTHALSLEHEHLIRIPAPIFNAYLKFLCGQQGKNRWAQKNFEPIHHTTHFRYGFFPRAIRLLYARLGPRRKSAILPWHTVMRALAGHRRVLNPTASWIKDDLTMLKTTMALFTAYEAVEGHHPVPFDCLCRCLLKVVRHKPPGLLVDEQRKEPAPKQQQHFVINARSTVQTALDLAKAAFVQVSKPTELPRAAVLRATSREDLPPTYHELSASHVRTYLEVLAKFGDVEEGVRVMDWVLASCDGRGEPERRSSSSRTDDGGGGAITNDNALFGKARDPEHKQWAMMREAFVVFRAIVDASDVEPEIVARMEARFAELEKRGAAWSWPSADDVEEYVQWRDKQEEMPAVPDGGGYSTNQGLRI